MLTRRIIPCLDVKEGVVVKGVRFREHQKLGDILTFAKQYRDQGADELVFYDITASAENRTVDLEWVSKTAKLLDIPFCVAGGIRTEKQAREILNRGADKISINSPALENPELITVFAKAFGSQCVVIGVDSLKEEDDYFVYQYTGSEKTIRPTRRKTIDWIREAQERGAGEIVLNCMAQDGVKTGYDLTHLQRAREVLHIPFIASGGAGTMQHFVDLFQQTKVDGALAAGVFHRGEIAIPNLKQKLKSEGVEVRL